MGVLARFRVGRLHHLPEARADRALGAFSNSRARERRRPWNDEWSRHVLMAALLALEDEQLAGLVWRSVAE